MPRDGEGRSWRRWTLCRLKEAVGPCGRWEIVRAVGLPRCSCRRIKSVKALELALDTNEGRTRLPRFNRIDVGRRRRISLANAASRVEGERDVVIRGRGSAIPERWVYSSSRASASSVEGAVSSYAWEARRAESAAREGVSGFPLASDAFRAALLEAVSADWRVRARR